MIKKEFFKRKNRYLIYHTYEVTIDIAYNLSECYSAKLQLIRALKDKYKQNSYIWKLLSKTEKDNASTYEESSFIRCNTLKDSNVNVPPSLYDTIVTDIRKLSASIGNMQAVIDFVTYLNANKLTVRTK